MTPPGRPALPFGQREAHRGRPLRRPRRRRSGLRSGGPQVAIRAPAQDRGPHRGRRGHRRGRRRRAPAADAARGGGGRRLPPVRGSPRADRHPRDLVGAGDLAGHGRAVHRRHRHGHVRPRDRRDPGDHHRRDDDPRRTPLTPGVDLHSDLLLDVLARGLAGRPADFRERHLEPLRRAGVRVQVLAVWVDPYAPTEGALRETMRAIAAAHRVAEESEGALRLVTTRRRARRSAGRRRAGRRAGAGGGRRPGPRPGAARPARAASACAWWA